MLDKCAQQELPFNQISSYSYISPLLPPVEIKANYLMSAVVDVDIQHQSDIGCVSLMANVSATFLEFFSFTMITLCPYVIPHKECRQAASGLQFDRVAAACKQILNCK